MTTQKFIFESFAMDYATMTVSLVYQITNGPQFVENYVFEQPVQPASDAQKTAITAAMRLLHLAAGVSYYKTHFGIPVEVKTGAVSAQEKAFFDKFYSDGLSEFIFRNDLDYTQAPKFVADGSQPAGTELSLEKSKLLCDNMPRYKTVR